MKRYVISILFSLILFGCSTVPTRTVTPAPNPTAAITVADSPVSSATPAVEPTNRERVRNQENATQAVDPTRSREDGNRRNTPAPTPDGILVDEEQIPLTDMGSATYKGLEGGLYPGGMNEMPEEHAREGLERASLVQPLDVNGLPSPSGKSVFLSIGMSNTMMEFCGQYKDGVSCQPYSFIGQSQADAQIDHDDLMIINGARGAQVADRWSSPEHHNYDNIRDRLLTPWGLSEAQVQVVWLKVTSYGAINRPSLPSDRADAYQLMQKMGEIVRALKERYPNLQQVFISSRTYAGYATMDLNPEPYAYETGFAVKWLIEEQIDQMANGGQVVDPFVGDLNYDTVAPWIAWGPYLWANGDSPRSDGLVWLPEDFAERDQTHPSDIGKEKVAQLLLDFFKTSPYTQCWFLATPPAGACDSRAGFSSGSNTDPIETDPIETTVPTPQVILTEEEMIPLTDLGSGTYLGFEGGLYPGGSNQMPASHLAEGTEHARSIQPLDSQGNPDPNGNYVFLSIGMSNTSMEFCRALGTFHETDGVTCRVYSFMGQSAADPSVDHSQLFLLNGARGGQEAQVWTSPASEIYDRIAELLSQHNLSEQQVQIVWLKVANGEAGGTPSLPSEQADAYVLMTYMGDIVRTLRVRYPNLQQVFISSRIYAGYTERELNPEPYAYESGFAVKWLIEAQIDQMASGGEVVNRLAGDLNYDTVAPWIAWGPYLWANDSEARSDGLVWLPGDFGNDLTHPSASGREKVGTLLLEFFKTEPYTQCWFLANADC